MEILENPVPEGSAESRVWPKLEEQELDVLAFELWQRGSRQDAGAADDSPDDEQVVACHASCL